MMAEKGERMLRCGSGLDKGACLRYHGTNEEERTRRCAAEGSRLMIFPPKFHPGDTIALVATSSPPSPKQAAQTVAATVEDLERRGYRVWQAPSLSASTERGYAVAPAEMRAADLNEAFRNPEYKAVWVIRGGSTAMELLPLLDYELIRANPKPFMGFSDVTALHAVLPERCGFVTYHGPVAKYLAEGLDDFSVGHLFRVMEMEEDFAVENPAGEPIRALRPGRAEGELTGGNLSLVAALMGTPYQLKTKGKILFLEDVGESVYRLDRMMTQLKFGGLLEDAAGIVLGDFSNCRNAYNEHYGPEEMMRDFFADYPKPVICGLKAGHCRPLLTLPMGCRCTLDAENAALIFRRNGKADCPSAE